MKRLFIITFILIGAILNAQDLGESQELDKETADITHQIFAESFDPVLLKEQVKDGTYIYFDKISDYYDLDLVKLKMQSFLKKYRDVVQAGWRLKDGQYVNIYTIEGSDLPIILMYSEEDNTLGWSIGK